MAAKAKVVLTDYVWESLDVEKKTLAGSADLVPLQDQETGGIHRRGGGLRRAPQYLCRADHGGSHGADAEVQDHRALRHRRGHDRSRRGHAAGIIVTNNPTYCIEEVAEHTMALLLACARKVAFYDRLVRAGKWEVPPGKPMFRLAGSTLGLVGFGQHRPAGGDARCRVRHARALLRSRSSTGSSTVPAKWSSTAMLAKADSCRCTRRSCRRRAR